MIKTPLECTITKKSDCLDLYQNYITQNNNEWIKNLLRITLPINVTHIYILMFVYIHKTYCDIPKLYALPKTHKKEKDLSFRPIVSTVDSHTYKFKKIF